MLKYTKIFRSTINTAGVFKPHLTQGPLKALWEQ